MNDVKQINETIFESIKHESKVSGEYWYARELSEVLGYDEWRNFNNVISKAMESCRNSGINVADNFKSFPRTTISGKNTNNAVTDYRLSRYACYLIVMNGDSKKEAIALGQTYFAVKTREAELLDGYTDMNEDEKRLAIRHELKAHNKNLASAAHDAGVITSKEYATFQNYGYKGLYGGLGTKEIKQKKNLSKGESILDHMGSTELAANLFRATQTEEKLKRDNISGKENANNTHYQVGQKVRETIAELGGTMPENLPTPEKSISQIQKEKKAKKIKDK